MELDIYVDESVYGTCYRTCLNLCMMNMCLNLCLNLLLILFLYMNLENIYESAFVYESGKYRRLIIKTACDVCLSQAVSYPSRLCSHTSQAVFYISLTAYNINHRRFSLYRFIYTEFSNTEYTQISYTDYTQIHTDCIHRFHTHITSSITGIIHRLQVP